MDVQFDFLFGFPAGSRVTVLWGSSFWFSLGYSTCGLYSMELHKCVSRRWLTCVVQGCACPKPTRSQHVGSQASCIHSGWIGTCETEDFALLGCPSRKTEARLADARQKGYEAQVDPYCKERKREREGHTTVDYSSS